jgi:hypothetical protein
MELFASPLCVNLISSSAPAYLSLSGRFMAQEREAARTETREGAKKKKKLEKSF